MTILDRFYTKEIGYVYKIDGRTLATAMGYNILFKRLSLNGKIKSKLIFDKKDVTIYDQNGVSVSMIIPENTILVDISLFEDDKLDNVIIHECVHAYLHHVFYYAQSLYRKGMGKELPEFQDYFYSSSQQECVLTEQIRTISVYRLKKYIGRLSEKDIRKIEKALRISLDLNNKEWKY